MGDEKKKRLGDMIGNPFGTYTEKKKKTETEETAHLDSDSKEDKNQLGSDIGYPGFKKKKRTE
jgi:hypothetical protein